MGERTVQTNTPSTEDIKDVSEIVDKTPDAVYRNVTGKRNNRLVILAYEEYTSRLNPFKKALKEELKQKYQGKESPTK